MMSLMAKCRLARPLDSLQTSPWCPPGSTPSPHRHWCGAHSLRPRRRPIATRKASLSRHRPHDEIGMVNSQSPEGGEDTATSLALLHGSVYALQTSALSCSISGLSQALCLVRPCAFPTSRVEPRADKIWFLYSSFQSSIPRMVDPSDLVDAADARYAEEASIDTCLIPRPPSLIGRVAFFIFPSSIFQLRIFFSPPLIGCPFSEVV